MKKTLFALAAVATLALSSTAAMAEGFFAGASIGDVRVSAEGENDSKVGGKIFYGYNFNQNVGVEFGYAHLGNFKYADSTGSASIRGNSLYADVVGTYPLANNFSLLGRVGVARTDVKVNATLNGVGSGSAREKDVALKIGAGVQYAITPALAVRGEWERYTADIVGTKLKANSFTVGLNYSFN